MTFFTVKTCWKSAPFRVRYLRAGGPVPVVTAGLSLFPASFTSSTIPLAYARDTLGWQGVGGAYHVPLDRLPNTLRGSLSPGRTSDDKAVRKQHRHLAAYRFGHGVAATFAV